MSDPPDVSVIVCVRDGARIIGHQLAALDAQVDAPAFEIVVVDNGSRDATRSVVRSWARRDTHAATSVHLVDGGSAPGIPRVRNLGARTARGRVLAFCDADDEVDPGWVAAMAAAVDDDQLAGGLILARTRDGAPRHDTFGPGLIATPYLPHVGNCNCAISRETFFAVGGYDESLPRYGFEDVDLSWRVQEAGHPIVFVPDAVVRFTLSGTGTALRKRLQLGEGRVLMAHRYPLYDPVAYTPRRAAIDLSLAVRRTAAGAVRTRRVDRADASLCVSSLGRLLGAIRIAVRGVPDRKLCREVGNGSAADGSGTGARR